MTRSKVTSDFIVDRLRDWWESNRGRFPDVTRLVLNLDNGPESHSRRTQFLKRMVGFAHESHLDIDLAYYPPYHSKYNPIERCWGILELHWNGALLDSIEAVLGYAETMTWKGGHPEVVLIEQPYKQGGEAEPRGDGGVGVEGRPPALPGEVVRVHPGEDEEQTVELTSFKPLIGKLGEQPGEVASQRLGALAPLEVDAEGYEELGQFGQRGAGRVWDSSGLHTRSTTRTESKFR
jgi:hypothetical protein